MIFLLLLGIGCMLIYTFHCMTFLLDYFQFLKSLQSIIFPTI